MATTWKDVRVFEKSLDSALRHMPEVDKFYIITPNHKEMIEKYSGPLSTRVIIVNEEEFPFHKGNVSDVMIEAVKQKGIYPISGSVLDLEDYVLLDSDLIWFRNVTFINATKDGVTTYNYVSSSQYHPPYMSTLRKIAGVDLYPAPKVFRSGIVHHMVIVKSVLQHMKEAAEALHGGIPFWKVLLNESALELTCRAPREGICGGGSTLSEYELYFNYARVVFPQTVALRPLLWANGPMPGMMFWPALDEKMHSDRHKGNWLGHRQNDIPAAFLEQIEADRLQGYDYVGYHGYAKRRYYELVGPDFDELCSHAPKPFNTTCSWRGFPERVDKTRDASSWFKGCACQMMNIWE
eukprot:gene34688-42005_t